MSRSFILCHYPGGLGFHVWWQRHDGIGGHVWLEEPQMRALREEMLARGMVCGREGGTGIPLHKLETAEDWFVSPVEIGDALEVAVDEPVTIDDRGLWHDWLEFLRGAERHGGLRVKP